MERRGVRRVRVTRDLALFLAGLGILLHQSFVAAEVAPELVTAAVALLLAPAVTRVDDAKRDRDEHKEVGGGGSDR